MHPLVAQMQPSQEQRPAIEARGRDVAVTAGAGTGKTRTLVARYLSFVGEGMDVREIVAITFTRKAAREMRNRVREEIRHYLDRLDLDEAERQRWQAVYRRLDAARIGTIHSLCSEIVRAHPAQAGVDPRFEVLDEGQTNLLRVRAVDETLAWLAEEPRVAPLFAALGERMVRTTLDALLQRRLDVTEALEGLPSELMDHWRGVLSARQGRCLDLLLSDTQWLEAVSVLRANICPVPDDKMELQRREALEGIDLAGSLQQLDSQLVALSHVKAINLRYGSAKAWPGGAGQLSAVKKALGGLRDLWKRHAKLLELTLTEGDETLAQALPMLGEAFRFGCDRYAAFKREIGALDFDDLEQGALDLLAAHSSARAHWQAECGAILVDEFQDTNGRQRDLLALLNGGRGRLFFVGDAKQSIYRFRGADVTVFREERDRVQQGGGATFSLATSFRGHEGLIDALNALLRPVLGGREDPGRPWAEPFTPLAHHRERPASGLSTPYIELLLTAGSKGGGALDRAADALVARIVELVDGVSLDYGDFAILCRASGSFAAYEDALEKARVPFLTVAGRGFYGRPEIRDLLNALQALCDPTDDLALAGLLRSPAFALTDGALYHLCDQRDQNGPARLWDVLRLPQALDRLPADDRRRADRAAGVIAGLHLRAGRISIADLLKAFLDGTDYRAALLAAEDTRGARNVSKLLSDAHASGIVGVREFLDYIVGLRDSGAREGEARATVEGAVQIMSVHAAKGLEFPVVIIGDVTHRSRGSASLLVDPNLGPLPPAKDAEGELPAIYRLAQIQHKDQEDAESDRLLYVAATRAREKLLLSGCIRLRGDGSIGKPAGWLGKVSGPDALGLEYQEIAHDENGAGRLSLDLEINGQPVSCTIYEPGCTFERVSSAPTTSVAEAVELPPPLLDPVTHGQEHVDARTAQRERHPRQRVWRVVPTGEEPRAPAWVIGSVVHEALAAWRFPEDGSQEGGEHSYERWAGARARGYGITEPQQLRHAIQHSRRLLRRLQAAPLYQKMSSADRRLHEVPYSHVVEGRVESGIIDALYLKDGVWTIVEFKTDEVKDRAALDRLLAEDDYVRQVRRYLQAAEQLLGRPARGVLCFLNFAGGVHPYRLET